jgi:hypothetical protein
MPKTHRPKKSRTTEIAMLMRKSQQNPERVKKIASSIGINPEHITEDMSLAEIYNYEEDANYKAPEERRVGFF